DTGISDSDNITSDNTPTFDFFGEAGTSFDFDGDGVADTFNGARSKHVITAGGQLGTIQVQALTLLLFMDGNLSLDCFSKCSADFNNDSIPDLAFVDEEDFDPNYACVLLGNGDGTFQDQRSFPIADYPQNIIAGDFNNDGNWDIATSSHGSAAISVLWGTGDGWFLNHVEYPTGSARTDAIAEGDFNNDGNPDLAATSSAAGEVTVFVGNGSGGFSVADVLEVASQATDIWTADFDNDGDSDIVTLNQSSDSLSVLLSNGDGTFQPRSDYNVGFYPVRVMSGDMDEDGNQDLVVRGNAGFSVLLGNGEGTFQDRFYVYAGSSGWRDLEIADMNGDGHLDVLTSGGYSFGNGDGTFQNPVDPGTPLGNWSILAVDLDCDGVKDVFFDSCFIGKGNAGVLPDGEYPFILTVDDGYGNSTSVSLPVTIDTTPPEITGWQIVGTHGGGVGEVVTNIADGYVEPRNQGVHELRIAFNEDIADNLTPADLSIVGVSGGDQSGLISSVSVAGSVLTVGLSAPLPDKDRYTVALGPDAEDIAGNNATGDLDLQIVALKGDANGDGMVNSFDLLNIRVYVGQALDAAKARYDINGDGLINSFDLLMARVYVGNKVT
ncbi:MAG TPA: FG-GAP-like repeat-containing protein, partial [Candidatus Brocadiia bacterium]|nr:FG-GAP-like repeat-containing protein [Candidatus Brocadiia bacterium]